jgi:hypothetical protein
LAEILSGLHEEGFRVLLLKGMPLGLRLYPDLGLRPRCDTDLLVERAALPALDRIMDGLGFVTSYPAAEGDYNAEVAYRPSSRERMFVYDVHWEISNKIASFSRAMGFEYLWSRSVELEVEGVKTRTLGDVDALLLACVHRAGHLGFGGERLIWLYDIHLLLERLEPSQKEEFAQRGVELGIQDECLDAVVKSAEWFSTTGCGFIVEFFHRAGANVGALANAVGRTDALKGRTLRELRRLQSAGERWGYLRRLLFPSREYMMHRYGVRRAGLLPFYYLYRIYFAGKVWLLG